eukprot:maker-scaffold_43-snap-gene-0.2-mRNA-1 protein AED:0.25 eAED:0.25 QI:70/0.66/0.5/1/1/1/4/0/98
MGDYHRCKVSQTEYKHPNTINNGMEENETIYDTVPLDSMAFEKSIDVFNFPCPCGDKFEIGVDDMLNSESIASCPSCSLVLKYDPEEFLASLEEDDDF